MTDRRKRSDAERTLFLAPSARLQRFLGRELVADANLAVAEFVKNGYDAGATEVHVRFTVNDLPKELQRLVIADNGTGMNLESFEQNWMHPGYSSKAPGTVRESSASKRRAWALKRKRVPIGEKGLGRFASGRLGDRLEVFTRKRKQDPWLRVVFDWSRFEDMKQLLADVPIPYDHDSQPRLDGFDAGTIVVVESLRLDWAGRVPGRKVLGRSDMRLGRLKQDLAILLQPFDPARENFRVYLHCDRADLNEQFGGEVSADWPAAGDYTYQFAISETAKFIVVDRRVTRSPGIAELVGKGKVTRRRERISKTKQRETDLDKRPTTLQCGGFKGRFIYFPRTAQRWKELGVPVGVFLYRDGIRVDPYGHGDDDWLGARARKAARHGHAAIQPNQLAGFVLISRSENRDLVDMSNRQGLVENEAYDEFVAHARAEFRYFEDLVLGEYVEPKWTTPEAKRKLAAERTQAFALALVRSIIHSVRQNTSGLGAEMSVLRRLATRDRLPNDLSERLQEIERRSSAHLEAIDQAVQRYLHLDEETLTTPERFDARDAVKEAIERVRPIAVSLEVELRTDLGAKHQLVLQRQALVEAVYELASNAVQARRPDGRSPAWVDISVRMATDGRYEVIVSDNGEGVDAKVQDDLGRIPVSTKGRPGMGLILVRELLALFGGTYSLVDTNKDGTTFGISLPGGLKA